MNFRTFSTTMFPLGIVLKIIFWFKNIFGFQWNIFYSQFQKRMIHGSLPTAWEFKNRAADRPVVVITWRLQLHLFDSYMSATIEKHQKDSKSLKWSTNAMKFVVDIEFWTGSWIHYEMPVYIQKETYDLLKLRIFKFIIDI